MDAPQNLRRAPQATKLPPLVVGQALRADDLWL